MKKKKNNFLAEFCKNFFGRNFRNIFFSQMSIFWGISQILCCVREIFSPLELDA